MHILLFKGVNYSFEKIVEYFNDITSYVFKLYLDL